jgi:antitoxin component YwqK of YwqJK toxin-antitoxin module
MKTSIYLNDNSLNKVKDFSAEKPRDYSILLLKNKIFNKVENTLEIKEFDEKTYFDDVLKLVAEYKNIKNLIIDSTYTQQEKKHKKEENYEELTHKIGHLNDSLLLPDDYKYLV